MSRSSKYGCCIAILHEILLLGSRATMLANKSKPNSSMFWVCCASGTPFHLGKVDLKSGNFYAAGHRASLGVPWTWKILKIWSISESPVKSAFLCAISAIMQPTDQMSTGVEYCFCPSKISGALYHSVTTSWVYVLTGRPNALASPKSASLIFPFLSINKFYGLRSLCITLWAWQYAVA